MKRYRPTWLMYAKEMRILRRDRRLVVGVFITSLIVFPGLMSVAGLVTASSTATTLVVMNPTQDPEVLAITNADSTLVFVPDGPVEPDVVIVQDRGTFTVSAARTNSSGWSAAQRITRELNALRDQMVRRSLDSMSVSLDILDPIRTILVDTSTAEDRGLTVLAAVMPYMIIVLLVVNSVRALYIAVGEKEKNTLAALLVSDVPRRAIVLGKTLAIMSFAVFASILLIVGMVVFANLGLSVVAAGVDGDALHFNLVQAALLIVDVAALALALAAVIMVLGTLARTQREAGIYTSPLVFLAIFVAIFSISSSDLPLTAYMIPILGNSLAMRAIVLNTWDAYQIILPVLSSLVVAAALTGVAVMLYNKETILFRK